MNTSTSTLSDQAIAATINSLILDDVRLSAAPIDVDVEHGTVRLTGTVQSWRRKLLAQEIAGDVFGVREVHNDLEVQPTILPDEEIADHVRAALDAHEDVPRSAITVSVAGGTAVLTGSVTSDWERTVAEDVALAARGVRAVDNQILIDPASEAEDRQVAAMITRALHATPGLDGTDVTVAVNGSEVVLSGHVGHDDQRRRAERVARRYRAWMLRNEITVGEP